MPLCLVQQVLGRNLEATITKAEGIKKEWKDDFTSVEHLVLAMLDDPRFGRKLLRGRWLGRCQAHKRHQRDPRR